MSHEFPIILGIDRGYTALSAGSHRIIGRFTPHYRQGFTPPA